MRKQGIYKNIDINEYHKEDGISSSGINLILDCPKRYWHEYMSGQPRERDNKFDIGSALHCKVLEPKEFDKRFFALNDDYDMRTKVGKEAYEKAKLEAGDRAILKKSDYGLIQNMAEAINAHHLWDVIDIESGNVEDSVYWDGGIYNTRLRARPDFYNDEVIIDFKTTESIPALQRSLFAYGYHRQAAMQIDGLQAIDGKKRMFGLFVVEKKAPYLTACFTLDEDCINKGREEYLDGASLYTDCIKYNRWDGYSEKFTLIKLPKWMDREAA